MTTPQVVARIDELIDRLQSDPTIDQDEVFDLIVKLQKIQAKAKVQAGMTAAALLDLRMAGIRPAADLEDQMQFKQEEEE